MTSTAQKSPLCSIVIRSYNEEAIIGQLLTGIMQQTEKDFEIILVDSGSTDRTVEIAAEYPVKIVNIRPEDFSFGRSLNLGISHTSGKYVVIASAHVYPTYPDWLERLIAPFNDPKVGLTYGKQCGAQSTHFSEHQVFAQWYPNTSQLRQAHPFCNNANSAIRRELWEEHAYDETLSGLEDLDWAKWVMENNYSIPYIAEAEICHVHNETPSKVFNRYKREAIAFKRIFPEERFNLWDFIRLFTGNTARDLWQAIRQRELLPNLGSIFWFRWNQFRGTYQGFRRSGPLTWQLRQTFYYPLSLDNATNSPTRSIDPIQYDPAE